MMSLPVVCSGVSCSARLGGGFLGVSGGFRPSSVLKGFLLVLLQGSADGVLHQPPADPQELRLVGFGPATPTWKKTYIHEDTNNDIYGKQLQERMEARLSFSFHTRTEFILITLPGQSKPQPTHQRDGNKRERAGAPGGCKT